MIMRVLATWFFDSIWQIKIKLLSNEMITGKTHKRRCKFSCEFHKYLRIFSYLTNIITCETHICNCPQKAV